MTFGGRPRGRRWPGFGGGARGIALGVALLLVSSGAHGGRALAEDARRFQPAAHFPADALAYLLVENAGRLKEKLGATVLGRIASHPGWRLALRGFRGAGSVKSAVEAVLGRLDEIPGLVPSTLVGLARGEAALLIAAPPRGGGLEFALALELGEARADIFEFLGRMERVAEEQTGRKTEKRAVGGVEAASVPGPGGARFFHVVLGTHLLVVSSPELLRDIVSMFEGGATSRRTFREGRLHAELAKPIGADGAELLLELDLERLRALLLAPLAEGPEAEETRRAFAFAGLDRLTSLGVALGPRDGTLDLTVHLGMRDGARGALAALQEGLAPLGDAAAALAQVPATAREIAAVRLAAGKVLRRTAELVRQAAPEAGEAMDGFFRILKERHGIAIEEDVFSLPDATFFSFAVEPPAGGLLADRITLVRTETFRPYLALLKKAAAAVGADVRSIAPEAAAAGTPEERPGGAAIEYVVLASGKSLGATIFDRLLSEENGEPSPASVAALIVPVVAWTELPDGWTAVSTLPQALVRHATHYARGKKLAEVPALADLFRARAAEGAAAAAVFESGKGLLWTYNTLLGLASAFAPLLAQAGVDLAQLPPAEAFEASLRPGFIQLRFAPDGFTLRGRDVLSSSSAVLAATGAAAIAAAVIVPAVIGARKQPRSRR